MTKRVVVTGVGNITSLGSDWHSFQARLQRGASGIVRMEQWQCYKNLSTRLGGPVTDFEVPGHYTRKQTRAMGRVALLATRASELAIIDAGLLDDPVLKSGAVGIAYGSSTGSTDATRDFAKMLISHDMSGVNATTYIRMNPV